MKNAPVDSPMFCRHVSSYNERIMCYVLEERREYWILSHRGSPGRQLSPAHLSFSMPLTHTHPFNGPFSGTTRVGRYQKSKTNLDFTEARDSEWQWHQLGHMQVCTSLQTDNHANTSIHSFLQARCPSCSPKNSFDGLKEKCTNFCPITLHNKRFYS